MARGVQIIWVEVIITRKQMIAEAKQKLAALIKDGRASHSEDGTISGLAADGTQVHLGFIMNDNDWLALGRYLTRCPTPADW